MVEWVPAFTLIDVVRQYRDLREEQSVSLHFVDFKKRPWFLTIRRKFHKIFFHTSVLLFLLSDGTARHPQVWIYCKDDELPFNQILQKTEVSWGEGDEDPTAGSWQRGKDDDPEEFGKRRHLNNHTDSGWLLVGLTIFTPTSTYNTINLQLGLQHQVRPDIWLPAECLGHRRPEKD